MSGILAHLSRLPRALAWAAYAYPYQRTKDHGVKASRYTAAMVAGMGAHLILTGGQCWRLPWLSPAHWLSVVAARRRQKA